MTSVTLPRLQPAFWYERLAALSVDKVVVMGLLFLGYTLPNIDFLSYRDEPSFRLDPQVLARLAVCGMCGLFAASRWPLLKRVYGTFPGAWLLLIGCWCIVTALTATSRMYSLAAIFANACFAAFIPIAIFELRPLGFVRTLFGTSVIFLVINWLLYYLAPSIGRGQFIIDDSQDLHRLGGDPQNLGMQAGWTILLALYLWRKGESSLIIGPAILFAAVTAAYTQSRTGIILCLFVVGMFVLFTQGRSSLLMGFVGMAMLLGAIAAGMLPIDSEALLNKISRSGKSEEIYNLTGRTFIWEFVFEKIAESPLTGHGFGCSRHALADFEGSGYLRGELHHAHNVFFNMLLTTGAPGVALLAMMFIALTWKSLVSPNLMADTIVLGVLLAGMAEPMIFGPMPRSHMVMLLLAIFWRPLAEPLLAASQAHGRTTKYKGAAT